MNEFINKIKEYMDCNNMLSGKKRIVVGVSGGADSMCLLSVLLKLCGGSHEITVIHVHHGLRDNADKEAEFVKDFCDKNAVTFKLVKVDVMGKVKNEGLSTEEAARILRYEAFAKVVGDDDTCVIAVAHNMDDQAETMLHNIFRGSSLQGLCGIRPVRDLIIRPLLCVSRKEIEDHLAAEGIKYCTDESNFSDDYERNRLRHNVIPYVTENINNGAVGNMFALSGDVLLAKDYLDKETDAVYEKAVKETDEGLTVSEKEIAGLHPYIKNAVLYKAFGNVSGALKDVEKKHIEIISDLFNKQCGRTFNLPYNVRCDRTYEGVLIRKNTGTDADVSDDELALAVPGKYEFHGYNIITENADPSDFSLNATDVNTKWFDYDKIDMLCVRFLRDDDYIIISPDGSKKKLSKFFTDEKVPQSKRNGIPLICHGSSILMIEGMRDSAGYRITDKTKTAIKITIKN